MAAGVDPSGSDPSRLSGGPQDLQYWIPRFEAQSRAIVPQDDPSHDGLHVERVVTWARWLAREEGADPWVVEPAACFHDFVTVDKGDARRSQASRLSAEAACEWLAGEGYPAEYLPAIHHAIEAHSFSAGVPARTLEAQVVQDADRLDALGAIGIARLFTVSARFQSRFYDPLDPSAAARPLDDRRFALDHLPVKLFGLVDTMHTAAARREGQRRLDFAREFHRRMLQEAQGIAPEV